MTKTKPFPKTKRDPHALEIFGSSESEAALGIARTIIGPRIASAIVSNSLAKKLTGNEVDLTATRVALMEACNKINGGDLSDVESMLYSQASALNLMFAEMNRRALGALYDGASFEAGKAYMGIALKAQNQCRMTLETLGNIKNPPTVFAKQANIAHGPQQVNNGTVSRAPAIENENQPSKVLEQSHEQRMDIGTQGQAGSTDTKLAALEAIDRAKDS